MTKTELIQLLADATSSDRKSAKMFLEGLTGVVEKTIKKGGEVPMKGLFVVAVTLFCKDQRTQSVLRDAAGTAKLD